MSDTKIYTQRMGVNLWQEVALRPAGDELVFAVKGDCGGFVAHADVRLSRRGVEELMLGLESWLQEQDAKEAPMSLTSGDIVALLPHDVAKEFNRGIAQVKREFSRLNQALKDGGDHA